MNDPTAASADTDGVIVARRSALRKRLRPIVLAAFLQNVTIWVPIEKLFMADIGFDAGSVALMAAAYSAVVPLLEVPSGVLADRWSRRGVMIVAECALIVSTVIGGLSKDVGTYIVAALFLGAFWAMQSGTLESIVYDTVLEETGDGDAFEKTIGRIRFIDSSALVGGALIGGGLAEVIPLRATYFLTVPFVAAAIVSMMRFREPRLNRVEDAEPLRSQIRTTYRTVLERGVLRPIVALMVLTALLLQAMLEFGPLWMVALSAPAALYGPHWAGLMASLGLGGLLGGHLGLSERSTVAVVGAAMVACCLALTTSHVAFLVVVAQVTLVLLLVAVSIPTTKRLHDAVPSTIRAGVASGVGTLTWLAFLPFALAFGAVSDQAGVDAAAWLLTAIAAAAAVLMATTVRSSVRVLAVVPVAPPFAAELFLAANDPSLPGHWASPPAPWNAAPGFGLDAPGSLAVVRGAIADLPSPYRDVIVLRDVDGRTPEAVQNALRLGPGVEREILNMARGRVRAALDQHFDEGAT